MKKHLIAAAVVSAFAVPAMAQNVQVYGIVDTAIQAYDSGSASNVRSADGVLATSRLGFRGTEDLGGGLKAIFQLEARLNPSAGSNGTTLFNRGAWVGLQGSFGTVQIGQNDTTTTQDIDSKVSQAGNLGLRATLGTADAGTPAAPATISNGGELGADVANVVRYISPSFSGFSFEVGYGANNSSATVNANATIEDVYVQYENGPLGVYAGRTTQDGTTAANQKTFKAIGGKYDFGMVRVGATYGVADANQTGDLKTTMLSAAAPLGNGLTLHGVYAKAEIENAANNKGDGYTVALTKALSKRTTVYAAYTDTTSESAGRFVMTGVSAGLAATNGQDASAFTFGVSHSF